LGGQEENRRATAEIIGNGTRFAHRRVGLAINILGMFGAAQDAVDEGVAGFNNDLSHVPCQRTGDFFPFGDNFA